MVTFAEIFDGSLSSMSTVPLKDLKSPLTLETIMWRILKPTLEWLVSMFHGAASAMEGSARVENSVAMRRRFCFFIVFPDCLLVVMVVWCYERFRGTCDE